MPLDESDYPLMNSLINNFIFFKSIQIYWGGETYFDEELLTIIYWLESSLFEDSRVRNLSFIIYMKTQIESLDN